MAINTDLASYFYVRGIVKYTGEESDYANIDECKILAEKAIGCIGSLVSNLYKAKDDLPEEQVQAIFYEAGKIHFADNLKLWFQILYEILLKQPSGPRLGMLTALLGKEKIIELIHNRLKDPFS